ncbi:universal stress protein [Paraburkholderia heleia]|uniref:universal stress protein n=1 Tax=Paraburkholderia heleia TaxID=634127 RepID=UPI0005A7A082|nr:universal stress protein [Paraburkholderia heleia]
MASYSRILLCYNATRQGRKALHEGAALALGLNAEAHLLAVVDQMGWAANYDAPLVNVDAIEQQTAQEILREGVADLASRGVFARGHLAIGDPMEQIPSYAEFLNVDLIVLGHHKIGRLARWWRRDTERLLLDRVRCGVLVVIDSR